MKYIILILFFFTNILFSDVVVKSITGDVDHIKVGDTLDVNSSISIGNNSTIIVENLTGKLFKLDKSGYYSIAKIESKMNHKSNDVNQKFLKFIIDELGDAESLLDEADLSENMTTLGAVERSLYGKILTYRPGSSYLLSNEQTFEWQSLSDSSEYIFIITNDLGEIKYSQLTKDTLIKVNTSNFINECYFWAVHSESKTSTEHCIQYLPLSQSVIHLEKISNLLFETDDKEINYFRAIQYCEKEKLLVEAKDLIKESLKEFPNSIVLKAYDREFKQRNGF